MGNEIATTMQSQAFGNAGMRLPPVCVGCAPLGVMPSAFTCSVDESSALEFIRAAFAGPFPLFDTSASYGDGESERRLGIVIGEMGGLPASVLLASKADRDVRTDDFSGLQMKRSIERSLRLLHLDRLDVCYLHDPEHRQFKEIIDLEGAMDTLETLRTEGVIRHQCVARPSTASNLPTRSVPIASFFSWELSEGQSG